MRATIVAVPIPARPTDEASAIAWLVERTPALRPILDEHVASFGELLPYVVFEGDFIPWFLDRIRSGDIDAAKQFLDALEPLFATDVTPPALDRVWNLAAVSFVEGTMNEPALVGSVLGLLGQHTAEAFLDG